MSIHLGLLLLALVVAVASREEYGEFDRNTSPSAPAQRQSLDLERLYCDRTCDNNCVQVKSEFRVSNCPQRTALYRYWQPINSDHFYTTNVNEIGTSVPGQLGHHSYTSEGVQCFVYTSQVAGTVPLFRYWKGDVVDHFYTTNANEIGTTTPGVSGNHGFVSEGIVGYCYHHPLTGTVPLYRYWKPDVSDHFYTINPGEIGTTTPGQVGNHGYISEGVACHVIAP